MRITNFDTCSWMQDCELTVFYDGDLACMDFSENFKPINVPYTHYDPHFHVYTDMDQYEAPDKVSDCYDLTDCSKEDMVEIYNLYIGNYKKLEALGDPFVLEEEILYWLDEDYGFGGVLKDGFPDMPGAKKLVQDLQYVTGYCQGDFSYILVWNDSLWQSVDDKGNSKPVEEVLGIMHKQFSNWFYDQPLRCELVVDGEREYTFHDHIQDIYKWDTSEILEIAENAFSLNTEILSWLKSNLPPQPDYR